MGTNPSNVSYDISKASNYLKQCLQHRNVTHFPTVQSKSRESTNTLDRHSTNEHLPTSQLDSFSTDSFLLKYFQDQKTRQMKHNQQKLAFQEVSNESWYLHNRSSTLDYVTSGTKTNCSSASKPSNTVNKTNRPHPEMHKQFESQALSKIDKYQHKLLDRNRKHLKRKQMTTAEINELRLKEKLRKQTQRSISSDNEKLNRKCLDRVRKSTQRKNMDNSELNKLRDQEKTRKHSNRHIIAESSYGAQKQNCNYRDKLRKSNRRKNMDNSELKDLRKQKKIRKHSQRHNITHSDVLNLGYLDLLKLVKL